MTLQLVLPNQPVADDPSESKCFGYAPRTFFNSFLLLQMCPACTTDARGRHLAPGASSNRSLQDSSTLDWSTTTEESPISHQCDRIITPSMRISRRRRRPRKSLKWRGSLLHFSFRLASSNSTKNYFQAVLRISVRYQLCNISGNVWPDSFHRRCRDRSASSTWSNFQNKRNEFRLTISLYSQIFCIFMLTLGFCYFLFLIVDIRLHVQRAKKAVKDKENRIKMFEEHLARTEARNWLRKL